MFLEIERKYVLYKNWRELVKDEHCRPIRVNHIKQAYLTNDPERVVRIRTTIKTIPSSPEYRRETAHITIKGKKNGLVAPEWEYVIPMEQAEEQFAICLPNSVIEKTRTIASIQGSHLVWEIDEFKGRYDGLVVAEIELPSENTIVPSGMEDVIISEVTSNHQYSNMSMAMAPSNLIGVSLVKTI